MSKGNAARYIYRVVAITLDIMMKFGIVLEEIQATMQLQTTTIFGEVKYNL